MKFELINKYCIENIIHISFENKFFVSKHLILPNRRIIKCKLYTFFQVQSFVKLTGIHYAGSHGMDIKGPTKADQVFLLCLFSRNVNWEKQNCCKIVWLMRSLQSNQEVMFQPASDYLPMIDEVHFVVSSTLLYYDVICRIVTNNYFFICLL